MRMEGVCGRRLLPAALSLLFLLLACWQIGEAGYIRAKAELAPVLLQRSGEEAVESGGRVRPWPWADTWPVARMRVRRLGVDQVVLAGASGRTLAFGPGWMEGTAGFTATGNSVVSGHRDTHFAFLQALRPGDLIEVTPRGGGEIRYAVLELSVVDQEALWVLDQGQPGLTLITCYPFDAIAPGGRERLVVVAEPVVL